jgi:hypothetical protein
MKCKYCESAMIFLLRVTVPNPEYNSNDWVYGSKTTTRELYQCPKCKMIGVNR